MVVKWILLFGFFSGLRAVPLLMSWTSSVKLFEESDTTNVTSLVPTTHMAIAVDYHYKRGEIYFSDVTGRISRGWLKPEMSSKDPVIIAEVKLTDGLAVDWVNDNIYWTDVSNKRVEMATLDGLYRRTLFNSSEGVDKPRAIVVDPSKGLLFWSDWGENEKVESCGLDGKQREIIVRGPSILWPNGLTLDVSNEKLYILEGLLGRIYSCGYDGSNLKVIAESTDKMQQAFGLTYYAGRLYWDSWKSRAVFSLNVASGSTQTILERTDLRGIVERMMGLKAVDKSLQSATPVRNPCSTAGCSHLCLTGRHLTASCVCPFGFTLQHDSRTCVEQGYVLVGFRLTLRRLLLDGTDIEPLIDSGKSIISVDYHLKKDLVFWSDIEEHRIYRAPLGQLNNKTVIARPDICDGLAVDWVHDVLYWTDTDRNTVEVSRLDGTRHRVLFSDNLDQPRALTLDPFERLLFWSDWGHNTKIERSVLDGTERKTIIDSNIIWPNGLSVDFDQKRIYWVDGKLETISSSAYDGTQRKEVLNPGTIFGQPFSISVFQDHVYFTDWATKGIYQADKFNITTANRLAASSSILVRPNGVKVVHSSLQKHEDNPCDSLKCRDLCLGSTVPQRARCSEVETTDPEIDVRTGPTEAETPYCVVDEPLTCDGKEDRTDGCDESVGVCAAIENIYVYKKNKTAIYFRCQVSNSTRKQLDRFVGKYSVSGGSDVTEVVDVLAAPCLVWPESYCFHISSLTPNKVYNFTVSAALKNGKVGNQVKVSAITKEEVPGPPEGVTLTSYTSTSLTLQWIHPNISNGMIRSFIFNILEVETYDETKCCQSYPILESPANPEDPVYTAEIGDLTPASTYAMTITSKTMYAGGSKGVDVHTAPPSMKILRHPNILVTSLLPLSWQFVEEPLEAQSIYHRLVKSYLLLLLSPTSDQPKHDTTDLGPLQAQLESKLQEKFTVLWSKNANDTAAFQQVIKLTELTPRQEHQLAWVQVSQYKDAYGVDFLRSYPFMAV